MQIFYDQCPDMWDSLLSAFWSIMYDDQLTLAEKTDAIEESLKQFAERIRSLLGTTEKSDNRTIRRVPTMSAIATDVHFPAHPYRKPQPPSGKFPTTSATWQ